MKITIRLFLLILLNTLIPLGSMGAEIKSGKVYRIKNIGKPGNCMAASPAVQGAVGSSYNAADLRQQWYITSNAASTGYYLRNVSSGAYLSSPRTTYTQWPLVFQSVPDDDTMLMSVSDYEGNKVIKAMSHNNSYAYAHNDGSNTIVCWLASSTPTQWEFEEVPYTQAEIDAILNKFENTGDEIAKASAYQQHLSNLFSDYACTELSVSGDLSANNDYTALPTALKRMIDKVKTSDWSETNGDWDSTHAKKYRVQLYEPYSEGSAASGFAGIQAYTNMNNPTGIVADAGEIVYVMVDQEPADGSTLYIGGVPDCNMYNSVTAGTKLKRGLNMILCNADNTHYFIYYTVNTVSGKQRIRKVTDFDPITIHIEGGRVNGFFNYIGDRLYAPDTEADYRYTIERASHPMFDLIGKYVILHFFKDDTPDLPGESNLQLGVKSVLDPQKNPGATKHYDPAVIMKAWDDMCFAERILMGIQSDNDIADSFNQDMYSSILNDHLVVGDYEINLTEPYSDYFNNRMMGITLQAQGLYMNATSWRTAYAPSTISAILSQFPQDGIWGPAHEYGHINQTPMRIAGTTEESNNVFSNVANYFVCKTTSRCDYPSSQLKIFNEGKTYLENGTWGTTRMFWQLWCYYHAAKHNTKFYPRLYELLRTYPLKRDLTTIPGKLNPKTDLLHFAKMCCIAANEDLTNFFTSWGFFVPQDNYHIDDYDVYDCILTQADIDEVKAEIKSYKFPENNAIILIDDRPGSDLPTGFGYKKELCGEYGGLKEFENPSAVSGSFSFMVDGTQVTVTGNGNPGVGYLIFDNAGNLIGFSNSDNFTLSPEAAADLIAGNATVVAIDADNKTIEVTDPVRSGDLTTKKDLLKTLIDRCDSLLSLADESETHVGHLFSDSCIPLKELRDETHAFWETAEDSDSQKLTDAYLNLSDAYYTLLNDASARIPVIPGAAYRMVNHNYTNRALDAGTEKCLSTTVNLENTVIPFSQQWVMESAGENNSFYIKNLATNQYVSTTKKQSTSVPLTDTPQSYTLLTIEQGVYAFAPDNDTRFGLHIDAGNNVVQWNTTSLPTQWTLVKTSTPEIIAQRSELSKKIDEANKVLASAGSMNRKEPEEIVFPENCYYTNAPYNGNNSDKFTTWSVIYDNNLSTFFHSNYDNKVDSEDGLDHYIRMEAPHNLTFRFFDLAYITRQVANTNTNPRTIVIEASADCKDWREIFHASGLPIGSAVEYSTGEVIAPENTKYIRMMVTGGSALAKGHPYFCVSELHVSDLGEPEFLPDEGFPYLTPEAMQTIFDEITDAGMDLAYSSSSLETLKQRANNLEAGMSALWEVMVPAVDVNSVAIGVDPVVMKLGSEPLTVNAIVDPENATFPQFEWTIENPEIAQIISTDGKSVTLKPIAMGNTTLSVTVNGNPLAKDNVVVKVLPPVPVESVILLPSQLSVPINAEKVALTAEVYPESASIQDLKWESSDPTIAEVDQTTGAITLIRQGICEISATSTDGTEISAKSTMTVTNAVAQGLLLIPHEISIQAGEQIALNVTYIPSEADQPIMIWNSSNPEVATVDPSGNVTGISEGSAVITVSADINGEEISASAVVSVTKPSVKHVALSETNLTLDKGDTQTLVAQIMPLDAENTLVWKVDNEDILLLNVSDDLLSATVTALKTGTTVVSVVSTEDNTVSASCIVTVPEISVEEIIFATDENVFDIQGGKIILSVLLKPEDAAVPRLEWQIDNPEIAELIPLSPLECELQPLEKGKATITVYHAERPEIFASREIEITGVSAISHLFSDKETLVDVYEMSGFVVRQNVSLHDLKNLNPGLYIIRQGSVTKEVMVLGK